MELLIHLHFLINSIEIQTKPIALKQLTGRWNENGSKDRNRAKLNAFRPMACRLHARELVLCEIIFKALNGFHLQT